MPVRPPAVWVKRTQAVADLRLGLEGRHGDRRDADLARAELDLRDAEVATSEVAVVHDLAVLHLDERVQLVRLAERVGLGHRLEVVDDLRRRLVVVGDAHRERNLGQPRRLPTGSTRWL